MSNDLVFQAIEHSKRAAVNEQSYWHALSQDLIQGKEGLKIDIESSQSLEETLLDAHWYEINTPERCCRRFQSTCLGGYQGVLPLETFSSKERFRLICEGHYLWVKALTTPARWVDYITLDIRIGYGGVWIKHLQPGVPCPPPGRYTQVPIQLDFPKRLDRDGVKAYALTTARCLDIE